MKTNQNNKKIITSYIKQLKATLICTSTIKKAFINEVKTQISELENQIQVLSTEDLHRAIGTPNDIARGFENREDIERLKNKAKKYTRTRILSLICFVLALIAITVTVIVIKSNDSYYTKTDSKINMENIS